MSPGGAVVQLGRGVGLGAGSAGLGREPGVNENGGPMRRSFRSFLAVCAAATGLAIAVAPGGGSADASPAARAATGSVGASTSTRASVPAGYTRVGGATQGISIAIPSSWVTVNLAQLNLKQALSRMGLKGVSQATLSQNMQALIKLKAVFAADLKSTASAPGHFATNINAYCSTSGTSVSGKAGVPLLRQSAESELPQALHAQHVTVTEVKIGGVPGAQVNYMLESTTSGTLQAAQLEVLPKPGRACFVTLTAAGPLPNGVLATAAATAQFP
jgi:hypothetical protein